MAQRPRLYALMLQGPAAEAITLQELKAYLHIDGDDDNSLLATMIIAARVRVEAEMRALILNQQWRMIMNAWPQNGRAPIPFGPLNTIDAARVYGENVVMTTIDVSGFQIDRTKYRPCIIVPASRPEPGRPYSGIEVDVTLGQTADPASVPQNLRQAIMEQAAYWFQNRATVKIGQALSPITKSLIAPHLRRMI